MTRPARCGCNPCLARAGPRSLVVGGNGCSTPPRAIKKSNMMKILWSSLAMAFLIAGCATGPRGFPPRDGITNLDRVNDGLYRGAQPNGLGIASLNRLGVKTIVNLRMTNEAWVAEEAEARKHGLILICFQDETNSGRCLAWQDHVRSINSP